MDQSLARLEALYQQYLAWPESDIGAHLPTLRRLAGECAHVTELGTRAGVSTVGLLAGRPKVLASYDLEEHPQLHATLAPCIPPGTRFELHLEDVLQANLPETDLLFIDTFHTYEQLRAELKRHAPQARRYIVLHDTTTFGDKGEFPGHLGLGPALAEFLARGTFRVKEQYTHCNGLTVLERCAAEPGLASTTPPARIYLGIPFYGGFYGQVLDSFDNALDPYGEDQCAKFYAGGAFHCRNFNQLWAGALNSRALGWTHFAMIHQDVRPEGYWLTTLLQLLRRHQADLLSVVLPIKTAHGLTSTALRDQQTGQLRRLTLQEIWGQPYDTFDAETLGFPHHELLTSTGLWLCDLTAPWVERVWFETRDRIVKADDGTFRTETISEDWAFAYTLHRLGLKVMATRFVPAGHWGPQEFHNDRAWGEWDTDQQCSGSFGDWAAWPAPGL